MEGFTLLELSQWGETYAAGVLLSKPSLLQPGLGNQRSVILMLLDVSLVLHRIGRQGEAYL